LKDSFIKGNNINYRRVSVIRKLSFTIDFHLLILSVVILCVLFKPIVIYAGTFYNCTDKEGNVTLSDYPKSGQTCKQVQTYEETKSTQEENTAQQRVKSNNIYAGDKITNVIVKGNLVVVPATLVYGKNEVDVQFVMDTGATGTAINTEIANRLSIDLSKARKGKAGVVGGIIEISVVRINSLTIGPHTIRDCNIAVVPQEGYAANYDGLLGMDVLGKLSFRVDLGNQVIIWE
jgi:clan AA aspartic protease (TIGR02281 family)